MPCFLPLCVKKNYDLVISFKTRAAGERRSQIWHNACIMWVIPHAHSVAFRCRHLPCAHGWKKHPPFSMPCLLSLNILLHKKGIMRDKKNNLLLHSVISCYHLSCVSHFFWEFSFPGLLRPPFSLCCWLQLQLCRICPVNNSKTAVSGSLIYWGCRE